MSGRPGFTLIELMITIALVGVLAAVAAPVLRGTRRAADRMRSDAELARAARGLMLLRDDIRGAAQAPPAWRGFSASEELLILAVPGVAGDGAYDARARDHIVVYRDPADKTRLLKQVFAEPGSRRASARQLIGGGLTRLRLRAAGATGRTLIRYEASFAAGRGASLRRASFAGAAALRAGGG